MTNDEADKLCLSSVLERSLRRKLALMLAEAQTGLSTESAAKVVAETVDTFVRQLDEAMGI